jgi:hypothetical protein
LAPGGPVVILATFEEGAQPEVATKQQSFVEKVVDWDLCTCSHWTWMNERAAETTGVLREERRPEKLDPMGAVR